MTIKNCSACSKSASGNAAGRHAALKDGEGLDQALRDDMPHVLVLDRCSRVRAAPTCWSGCASKAIAFRC